jgi:effector-binding domain-containing protein
MLDTPQIVRTEVRHAAVIRLTIPRAEIQRVMGPAIQEVLETVAAQGQAPTGPVYSYHYRMDPEVFDFDVGVPVARPITPSGRVTPGTLRAATVARTVYRGPYEGLGAAWGAFNAWITRQGHAPGPDLWECYAAGPESGPDPAHWRTELHRPLRT